MLTGQQEPHRCRPAQTMGECLEVLDRKRDVGRRTGLLATRLGHIDSSRVEFAAASVHSPWGPRFVDIGAWAFDLTQNTIKGWTQDILVTVAQLDDGESGDVDQFSWYMSIRWIHGTGPPWPREVS
ncbi:MAG TPA: hypothetical protein VFB84_06745 [Micromonosporaceae bacterium]|nr:hypothetical protein [Micromonosporaceae bacterium]